MHDIKSLLFSLLSNLKEESNSHLQGTKRVFIKNNDTDTPLTQFAHGAMKKGEESGLHSHKTMDEYFYFIKGNGLFIIEAEIFDVVHSSFIRVPAGTLHNLKNENDEILEFVYFGIAL